MVRLEEQIPEGYLKDFFEELYNYYNKMYRVIGPIFRKPNFNKESEKYNIHNKFDYCHNAVLDTITDIKSKTNNNLLCLYDKNEELKSSAVIIINEDEVLIKDLIYFGFPSKLEEFAYVNELVHYIESEYNGYKIIWQVAKKQSFLTENLCDRGYHYKIDDDTIRKTHTIFDYLFTDNSKNQKNNPIDIEKCVTLLLEKDLRVRKNLDEWTRRRQKSEE